MEETVLTRRLLADPAFVRLYLDALQRTVDQVLNAEQLGVRVEGAYALVREAARLDPYKPFTESEFESEVARVRRVVAGRRADVTAQVGALAAP
jgi:hypothetical protein